jgi:hypothetical protein
VVKALVASLAELAGGALVVYGIALLSVPAALIVGGLLVIAAGATYAGDRKAHR